jgi:glycosyltransferase involved in cell wall biosynthesis
MKILYILHSTDITEGSIKSFLTLLDGLMQKGIIPVIILPDNGGIYSMLMQKGIKVLVLPLSRNYYPSYHTWQQKLHFLYNLLHRIINNYIMYRKIETIIRSENVDIVHTNTSVVSAGLYAAKALKIPHLCHIREYGDKDFGMYYIPSRKIYRCQMSGRGCYTICITKDIQKHHGLSQNSRSRVIYNGIVSASSMSSMNLPSSSDGKYILFVGRIEPGKGLSQLVEAYISYCMKKYDALSLLIAGNEDNILFVRDIKNRLTQAGLIDNKVKLLGPRNDIDSLMRRAHAIVIPSKNEAFGRCMPEAMINKCIVIGRDTAGTKEQLDNGLKIHHQEIALRYNTTDELTQLLIEVTSRDKSFYNDMIQRAYDTVVQLYSNESYINNVYKFYQDILNNANL